MRELIFLTIANNLPRLKLSDKLRPLFLKLAGIKIKGQCTLWGTFTVRPIGGLKNIEIGNGTFINTNVRFGVPQALVRIGCNVNIGPSVMFETVSHDLQYKEECGRVAFSKPITVEDEVWIGANVVVTQGVTIGKGAVVAAGAVVSKDVAEFTLVGGVPAKVIKHLK
ncbi:transferase [Oleiphilus sp. HI0071]|uniref:DapH/DapD/GlmU-related protein n=1 Tax=Oleiphilus sp. HI0080 TaxID=1822255 RepID=UPI0007C3E824|nr:DapH/DapD/GlmU-related protein [Oleiphilus sp. HI0080]KZY61031.1 transferase [Oleiphilus sp. HI0065]KZY87758.1 transferase [Oleiphilus sp. HI0071]KZY89755.1 transferase [Oleiphilus sp. HI0073]KZZ55808.1 transferase [Oleiphilus sp. HI0122]KZY90307.1 transferase [Oleiphilus sp. HI0071]